MDDLYSKSIRPEIIENIDQLASNANQVAGHSGICTISDDPDVCLKPFNTDCVRGRREHMFYQLISFVNEADEYSLAYKHFPLLTLPSQRDRCDCVIDVETLISLTKFVPKFYHVKYLSCAINPEEFIQSVYSDNLKCPCYGNNPAEKSICAREYDKVNFLCLEDLTAHCSHPCVMDIKIGRITYDPMAIKEKVVEQSTKYERMREFGFRILGVKLGLELRDKTYGHSLETNEQVLDALDSFFRPLNTLRSKFAVISQIMNRLESLSSWFETKNINQLRFFSSSLLIVYDSHQLAESVRVSMIDFAHVFHVHDPVSLIDNNYLFGLRKLKQFLASLMKKYTS